MASVVHAYVVTSTAYHTYTLKVLKKEKKKKKKYRKFLCNLYLSIINPYSYVQSLIVISRCLILTDIKQVCCCCFFPTKRLCQILSIACFIVKFVLPSSSYQTCLIFKPD